MVEFFQAGGFGMWIVLAVGAATLLHAGLFAWRADERRMAIVKALTVATLFSASTALFSNLGAVFYKTTQRPEWAESPDFNKIVILGLGESIAPVILASAMLTLTWLIAAVGVRRLADRISAFRPAEASS